jgi:hypothetical protein
MPKSSLADFISDWETLLKNVTDTATELPDMDVYKATLEQLAGQAKDGIALAHSRRGFKQQETRDLRSLMIQGKDAAAKLRSAIKAHFGPRSERLVQYGMTPIRKPDSKNQKPKPADPAPASPSETTPQAS